MDNSILNGCNQLILSNVNALSGAYAPIDFSLECQSGTTEVVHASNSMHENTISTSSASNAIDDGFSIDAGLESFLSRKVKITTSQWAVGNSFGYNVQPWSLFLNNPAVKNKLQNYQLLKGSLKLTIFVNGTPFHKGMLLGSYSYLNVTNETETVGGDIQLVTRSQRPHVFLNVSTCKSGCLCLPFFMPTNYLSLTDSVINAAGIGRLNIDSFLPLEQLNGGTDVVTVTVFAEMVGAKLSAPTMNAIALSGSSIENFQWSLEPQAGSDEYDNTGVISGPASAVAAIAGKLSSIPFIAPFALATQIGANAVGGIARLFGYARPVQLADVAPMRNFPISSLALCEGADTSQKLTVTGKAELSVDPSLVELPSEDDMLLSVMTQRESYITQFPWAVTDLVDTVIFAMDVNPMAEVKTVASGGTKITPTSLSFATRMFAAWSGTLKYRFQVVASQYHRGRLAIVYDPKGAYTGDPFNTTFNTVIDLADARDFTVEFNWQQDRAYMDVATATGAFWTKSSGVPAARIPNRLTSNGIFYVVIVNELVTPDSTTGIELLVSISAGEDFELANPKGSSMNVYPYPTIAQSGNDFENFDFDLECQSETEKVPVEENAPEQVSPSINVTSSVKINAPEKPLIFYGERIVSCRQLLKRYCFYRTLSYTSVLSTQVFLKWPMRQMPAVPGFDPNGPDTTAGADQYIYAGPTYLNYLKLAYAGWKGSIRWKFLPNSAASSLTVARDTGDESRKVAVDYSPSIVFHPLPTMSDSVMAHGYLSGRGMTGGGTAMTQCRSQDALEVEVPYTTALRFSKVEGDYLKVNTNTLDNAYPGGDTFNLYASSAPTREFTSIDTYVAVGEDFSLMGWVGAPTLWSSALPPV